MILRWIMGLALALWALAPLRADAHALQPGYLEISPVGGTEWRVLWRVPDVIGAPMQIRAVLPQACTPRHAPKPRYDGVGWRAEWVMQCENGVTGGTVHIDGLERTQTDVLVRLELPDGAGQSFRLTPENTTLVIPTDPGAFDVLKTYLPLGVTHILEGLDHLLFVFALLLLITDSWRLVGAITAFTVAHSFTMAAAVLGQISLPGPPVEAVIALSIMFLASELLLKDDASERLSQRYPWAVSFSFGLLHGFGFAGALTEIGLPQGDVPMALLSFNIGVEIGQLIFVTAILGFGYLMGRLSPVLLRAARRPGSVLVSVGAYGIGGISAYWFIDRVAGF